MAFRQQIELGATLAGYRIISPAGSGGSGVVYRARDDRLNRDVALKVLSADLAADPANRARLIRESRLAASLDHPNVVPVYDAGEASGHVFIAMRFVDGTDLAAELGQRPMAIGRVMEIAAQVAAALDAAHEQGLVHRDVKPSNVLIDRRGHCYLTDFGISLSAVDPLRVADTGLVGTVDYVAPEQIRGENVDGRGDLYSLACMSFEMFTGQTPFRRTTDVATLFAHLDEDPPSAGALRPELPVGVDDVLRRGLAKDADQRPSSCRVLVEELQQALGVTMEATGRRRRLPTAVLATAVLLVILIVAVTVIQPWRTEPPTAVAGALVRIDPVTAKVTSRLSVPGYPSSVASAPGGIWMADFREGVLWRYDTASTALRRISSPGEPRDLAVVGDDVYVASDGPESFSGNVSRHNSATGVREEGLTMLACAVGSGDGVIWVAGCPFVSRLDTGTGPLREVARVLVPYADPLRDKTFRIQVRELAVGLGSVWVLGDAADRRMWRLDELTGRTQATIDLPFPPRSVAVGDNMVWITDSLDDAVVPVDPNTERVLAPVPVGRGAAGVAAGAGAVWVANAIDGTVSRIDPRARRATDTVDVGGVPHELAVDQQGVWVTTHAR